MRLTSLAINGFGIFRDIDIQDLPPGLTLLEGHNEAGKSTLMAFIRAVLFGFESRKSAANRYEPLRGGKHGGALTLVTDEGQEYEVHRVEGGAHGRVTVFGPDGQRNGDDLLARLLHGTTKTLYQNVFAFGLTELQRLDTLQADEVSHHIYTAGMGTGSIPFSQVIQDLEDEQGQLFKPGGRKPIINVLLSKLDETERSIQQLQVIPDEYHKIRDQITLRDQEVRLLQERVEGATRRVDWVETLLKARPDWERIHALRHELAELLNIDTFPEGGVERLEEGQRALADLEQRRNEILTSIRQAEDKRTKLVPDSSLLEQEQAIDSLSEHREHFRKLLEGLPALRGRVHSRRQALDDLVGRLGSGWDDTRVAQFDSSIPMREQIRMCRDRLIAARLDLTDAAKGEEAASRARREKEAELDRLQRHLETMAELEPTGKIPLEDRELAFREWIQHYHHLELTRQHHQDIERLRAPLADQIASLDGEITLLERQIGLPTWMIAGVGLLFGALGGTAFYINEGFLGGALVACGVLSAGLLLWRRDQIHDDRQRRVDDISQQRQLLVGRTRGLREDSEVSEDEIRRVTEKMDALSLSTADKMWQSLQEVEEGLRSLETERRLVERRKDLEGRIQEQEEVLVRLLEEQESMGWPVAKAEEALQEVQAEWTALLKSLDLKESLTPDGVLEVLANLESAKVQLRDWQESVEELVRKDAEVESFHRQVNQVLERCQWRGVDLSEAAGMVLVLRKALEESLTMRRTLDQANDFLTQKRKEVAAVDAERDRLHGQVEHLLQAAGAQSPEDFRRRAAVHKRRVEMDREHRQLEVALTVHAGSAERFQELEDTLARTSSTDLEREYQVARVGERDGLVEALNQALQEKGRLEQQRQSLERNEQLSAVLLEHQTLLAQLDHQARQWAIRGVTRHLLDKARQIYERERQPAVLRQASEFFKVMTGGRYRRVIAPLGEIRLVVETKNGKKQGTDRLSRGTAEQLYLAMRLAFVREYAKHATTLPVVMDDILVNFDPNRAKAAIEVLKDMTSTHQILFFTCHPHVSQWFQDCVKDISVRSLTQGQ